MAELYRHTDEAGDTFAVLSVDTVVGLIVLVRRGDAVRGAVEVSDVDGRRLLAALLSYYEPPAPAAQAKREEVDG